jgi:hypothetical protein
MIEGEWRLAPTMMTTDANGLFSFDGFLGEYELSVGNQKTLFSLKDKGSPWSLSISRPGIAFECSFIDDRPTS